MDKTKYYVPYVAWAVGKGIVRRNSNATFSPDSLSQDRKEIEGRWYYFYANGSLSVNTVIDKYSIDNDRIRIRRKLTGYEQLN